MLSKDLIGSVVGEGGPAVQQGAALVFEKAGDKLDRASAESLHLLVGDRELVESEPLHVFDPGAEVDSPDPRPVDSREAHRARLRRAVYLRALQRMGSELPARLA